MLWFHEVVKQRRIEQICVRWSNRAVSMAWGKWEDHVGGAKRLRMIEQESLAQHGEVSKLEANVGRMSESII